jgi:hypothetical protein
VLIASLYTHPKTAGFWGKFLPLGDKRKSSVMHTKAFSAKNAPKLVDFEEKSFV